MADLIWLASYPKSGNTWFRSILTALTLDLDHTPDLNRLVGGMLVGWHGIEDALGIKSTELTRDQLLELRPMYARSWASQAETDDPVFVKTHDRLDRTSNGDPITPPEVTRVALYFVRNPLDVAVSYAHHSGVSASTMMTVVNNPDAEMARPGDRIGHQIPQPTGCWSDHYRSWTFDPPIPVHHIRYEDMVTDPIGEVTRAVAAAALDFSREQIERAVELTAFDRLSRAEADGGFRERASRSERFFRQGRIGSWRDELTEAEAGQIVASHRDAMSELGYLDADGNLTV